MGLEHSMPGPYILVLGCSTIALEGFLTLVRVAEGISHQRASNICYTKLNLGSGQNPDTGRKSDPEPDMSPGRHSHVFRMVPARVVAVPTHGRPVVMNFNIVFMIFSMKFE